MLGVGFRRLFWIGAAALLAVAALVAIVALVRGELTDTDGMILGTLAITLGAGSVCLAGLALVDRRDFAPLGWAAVAVGLAGYAVIVREIWSHFDGDEPFVTALLLLGSSSSRRRHGCSSNALRSRPFTSRTSCCSRSPRPRPSG